MDFYKTVFKHAASLSVERVLVLSPKQGLSEPCRRRVIKPNDLRCRNHHRKGITVLLHSHQKSSADIWPGRTEKVASSGNGIGVGRQLGQCPIGTMMYRCIVDGGKHRDSLQPAAAAARPQAQPFEKHN
jgi:hypothetical protein